MAHSFIKTSFLAGLLLCLTTQAAWSQNHYNYRMGSQRVECGHNGLAGPSSSYITGGTLSHSAQVGAGIASPYAYLQSGSSTGAGAGMTPGISGNSGLQSARMGSTVGMPGDYMRSDLNPNFSYQQGGQPRQGQRRQQVQYNQQAQNPNMPATYGQPYARTTSMHTGRQATQIPTVLPGQQPAQQQAPQHAPAAGASPAASTGTGGGTAEFKGY